MTYAEVVERLEAIEKDLEKLMPGEASNHPAAAYFKAKREWEKSWAEVYITTVGTVDERRNKTILELYDTPAYKALVLAEAAYESNKAVSRLLETRASIGQSLLRALTREAPQGGPQPDWSRGDPMARRGMAA